MWTMTLQNGPHKHLQEARKEAAKGCSWSRQDQHPLPSQILHLQLHPNSRIHIFWIKHIYRKKGINTCTHPARVKVCGKGQILFSTENKLQKMLLEVRPPKNPHWSKHSAGSDHVHSLQIHPPQAQCWWAESWFLTHEGTGKNSHWISLLTTRNNSTRLSKWLPDRGTVGNDESLTLHTCAAELN